MGVENLKRWHWAVIGVALGLVFAWLQISVGNDQSVAGPARTIGQEELETELGRKVDGRHPIIKDLRVYPDGPVMLVRMKRLVPLAPTDPKFDPKNPRLRKYQLHEIRLRSPFAPVSDPAETVDVVINPLTGALSINHDTDRRSKAKGAGWTAGDPGSGANFQLALRPAAYQLFISTSGDITPGDISASLGGHPLPPFTVLRAGILQSSIPAGVINSVEPQPLQFARGDKPVVVKEIHLLNPSYTFLDFLAAVTQKNPSVAYRFGWWTRPGASYALWSVSGLVVVGGLWPWLLGLLAGAGLGRAPAGPKYDLSRFKSEPEPDRPNAKAADASGEDKLRALEEELARGLSSSAPSSEVPAAAPAIRQLRAAPAEKAASAEPAEAPKQQEFSGGVFYPVSRGSSRK